MPKFGKKSLERLDTCHKDIQTLMFWVIKTWDCTILEGHRGRQAQDKAVADGRSKTPWPKSLHNRFPSWAVDVAPYPIDWENRERFAMFVGFVLATALELKEQGKIKASFRSGMDWNKNGDPKDDGWDAPHIEITEEG